jgi:uncharacterized protein (TIGR02453 family)
VTFRGWPEAALDFYAGLEADNSKDYWLAHRDTYESDVKEPFLALSEIIEREFGPLRLFRPYRDTRFSKDKTPYKTQFSAAIGDRSKRGLAPGYYFHIDHQGVLLAGGGVYRPDPATLLKIRRHIAAHPEALTRLLRTPRFKRTYGGLADEEALARPPKGFAADLPHIDAIKLKHFFGIIEIDLKKHPSKNLAGDLADHFRDLLPMMTWLRAATAGKPR